MIKRLAFIGLGVMGASMAEHLLRTGLPLSVHTRTRSRASRLIDLGAVWANTPADAAQQADAVFICVNDTPDAEKVILGEKGVASVARPGMVVVDHSTISPSATRAMAQALAQKQTALIDAPVSGGDVGAKAATLAIMVGGERGAFEEVEPLLRKLGSTITYCGASGCGQLTKLVNQILVSVTNLAVCEALVFAKKHGLDLDNTLQAVEGGAGASWQLVNLGPRMISNDMRPGFSIALQQKDLRLVLRAAEESNTSLPAASLVHQLFTAAQAAGHSKDGTQALYTVVEKLASLH